MHNSLMDPNSLIAIIFAMGAASFATLMLTSYTKLVVVLGLLRTALGLQQTPPNMVLNGVAVVLSIYIMAPVGMDIADAWKKRPPSVTQEGSIGEISSVIDIASPPLREFLQKHAGERERQFFIKSASSIWPKARVANLQPDDFLVLIPSFVLSELTRAFEIGFVIYIVFVVVDLIVATALLALGMSMISPNTISLPFKLLLFVMLDGWGKLVQGLIMSYR